MKRGYLYISILLMFAFSTTTFAAKVLKMSKSRKTAYIKLTKSERKNYSKNDLIIITGRYVMLYV